MRRAGTPGSPVARGYRLSPPEETAIGLDTAYSTANFRRPEAFPGEPIIFITGPAPHFTRRGYVITIENGTLLVSLIGRFGDFPPTDKEGFLAFASELHSEIRRTGSSGKPSNSARLLTIVLSAA